MYILFPENNIIRVLQLSINFEQGKSRQSFCDFRKIEYAQNGGCTMLLHPLSLQFTVISILATLTLLSASPVVKTFTRPRRYVHKTY